MQPKRDKLEAWKYLVDDFLEMACFLNKEERGLLIEKISSAGASSETISSHPAFSLAGKLITVADKEKISEVWLYDAEKKKVKCFRLSDGQTR